MVNKNLTLRPVPTWAAGLVSCLSRDRPAVVTRKHLTDYLADLEQQRDLERTVRDLQQLGWLSTLHLKGVWAFVPAGESRPTDPYLDLRGWEARDSDAVFVLAGEAAAWHLGYVSRRFDGPPTIWLPSGRRVPHGLRPHIALVQIDWAVEDVKRLCPSSKLLHSKGLDLTNWATGLPALGPDALLVQLAARPGSFRTWADLIAQLDSLAADCDLKRLPDLLSGQSSSAWQRAAYLLDRGGRRDDGLALLAKRPSENMPAVTLGNGPDSIWSKDFKIIDHLVAPLQKQLGKA